MPSYRISVPESIIRFIAREISDWRENADQLGLDIEDVFQFNTTLVKKLKEMDSGNTLPNNPKYNSSGNKIEKLDSSEFAGLTSEQMMQKLIEDQEKQKQSESSKASAFFDSSEL